MWTKLFWIVALTWPWTVAASPPVGHCRFDVDKLSFEGSATEQARCLLSPVIKSGRVGTALTALPPTLDRLLSGGSLPSRDAIKRRLDHAGVNAGDIYKPVSRAGGGSPTAPAARYFVIHDTSWPYFGNKPFPADLDTSDQVNSFSYYFHPAADPAKSPVAHFFINRRGEVRIGHDLSAPWRATKFETQVVGLQSKGLFLHVENVQPRRRDPRLGQKDDSIAPRPGLTDQQYERLSLIYIAASSRAGAWLIPAFHAVLDHGISNAHDDPQNFDLSRWDAALQQEIKVIEQL